MQKITRLAILLHLAFLVSIPSKVLAQCPGCIIALPPLQADTIYLSDAPDGEVFVEYDANLSFRLPMTTTPVSYVDPTVPPGFVIDQFTITGVSGLPAGLNWEANQTVFNPAEETDGCVRICGTPVVPGFYEVGVEVDVVVFGINNSAAFPVEIYIAPSTSTTDGFTMSNNSGCGEVTVDFTNNVPSNGNPGFSYFWNFGNGNTSTAENPLSQTYSDPGTYVVEYQASVDTIGFILNLITIEASDCDDIIGGPDFYVIVTDPMGNDIYTSGIMNDATPPVNFPVNIDLQPGNYSIEVRDDELIGSVSCGSVNFTQNTMGLLTDGSLEVSLNILNPISTVTSTDTVFVYEIPDAPVIATIGGLACAGDTTDIIIQENNYGENFQWFQDSIAISGATGDSYGATESGEYWVEYTSPEGCFTISNAVSIAFTPAPPTPFYLNLQNVLTVAEPDSLPANYTLSWFQDGNLVYTGPETEYCATESGTYTLVVEDLNTGCVSSFEQEIEINPEFDCTVATEDLIDATVVSRVFPNPFGDRLFLEFSPQWTEQVQVRLYTVDGRLVRQMVLYPNGQVEIATGELPAGFYLLELRAGSVRQTIKLVK